jgi:hypothetical protein
MSVFHELATQYPHQTTKFALIQEILPEINSATSENQSEEQAIIRSFNGPFVRVQV